MNAVVGNVEGPQLSPAIPGARRHEFSPDEFVDHALETLAREWGPKMVDLRRRCAEAAMAAAPRGALAVREAVEAVSLEVTK